MNGSAEWILSGGAVLTMDPRRPAAEAVAVRDGMIVAVGTMDEVRSHQGARTQVVDTTGGVVLPGINDSHLHLAMYGQQRPPFSLDVGRGQVRSIADVAARVREAARDLPPGAWIRGMGWDVGYLDECVSQPGRLPSRQDLDAATDRHPIALHDFSGHGIWTNTRAVELAGITSATETPAGSLVVRDEHGVPTGLFREPGATNLVLRHVPPPTPEQRRTALRSAIREVNALGVTSVTDPVIRIDDGLLDAYVELASSGELQVRVSALMLFWRSDTGSADEMAQGIREFVKPETDPRWFRIIGAKIFGDGVPPLKTAWLHESYPGGGRGSMVVAGKDDEARCAELARMVELAHAAGYQVGIHATGDATIDATVAAFVSAVGRHPRPDPRHYVIHGDLVSNATLDVMSRHGFGVNMQPQIKVQIADLMDEMLGASRSARQWPMRSALDRGVKVASSSDAPVQSPDWRLGVAGAVLRESGASGRVSGSRERISVEEALHTYTDVPAWQDFAEGWKGRLAAGMVADICVLDQDPRSVDPHHIPEIPVTMTFVGGKPVHPADR
jgi:predicted amidohydrolase YtcJ